MLPLKTRLNDPDLRDRLYELLEHDHLPYSTGSRFVRLIIAIIILYLLATILASVPEFDTRFAWLFTAGFPDRSQSNTPSARMCRALRLSAR